MIIVKSENGLVNPVVEVYHFVVEFGPGDNGDIVVTLESLEDLSATGSNLKDSGRCVKKFKLSKEQLAYLLSQLSKAPPWDGKDGISDHRCCFVAKLILVGPERASLDYKSNEIATMTMVEKRELEHSLNWLSTLGGAFSALGDNDLDFAARAGQVSRGQLLIAVRLGSPQIMARCRLYASISLLQLGNLKAARQILLREYEYAKSLPPDSDPRLKRMCIGIWAKLRYEWRKRGGRRNGR